MLKVYLFLSALHFSIGDDIQCNIHIKIPYPQNSTLASTQGDFTALFSNPSDQKIDFMATNDPHVTLFLTAFSSESLDDLFHVASTTLKSTYKTYCSSSTSHTPYIMKSGINQYVSGSYAMLNVSLTDCLQALSDELVLAAQSFVSDSAKEYIPSWIYNLPDDEQAEKIELIKQYGSPNVFSGFSPHVTFLVDDVNSTELSIIFDENQVAEVDSSVQFVGFGAVGNFGSVLKGQDFAFPVDLATSSPHTQIK